MALLLSGLNLLYPLSVTANSAVLCGEPSEGDGDGDGQEDIDEVAAGRDPQDAADFAFEFAESFEGWVEANEIAAAFVSASGELDVVADGGDPFLIRESLGFDSSAVSAIRVRYRKSAPGALQLFWGTETRREFNGDNWVGTNWSAHTGTWQEGVFHLANHPGWDGRTIQRLRLDVIAGIGANTIVDWIRADPDSDGDGVGDREELEAGRDPASLTDFAFEFTRDDDVGGWNNSTNVEGLTTVSGSLTGVSVNEDPLIQMSGFQFPGARLQTVVFRIRASKPSSLQMFWATESSQGAFSGSRFLSAPYDTADEWQIIQLALEDRGDWTGEIITRLRIDPVVTADARFEVDWIRGSDGDLDDDGYSDVAEGDQDPDRDGLPNFMDTDSDGDGLADAVESGSGVYVGESDTGTRRLAPDSDNDGLSDAIEVPSMVFAGPDAPGTDPNNPDSDGDGFQDGTEVELATDPTDPESSPRDQVDPVKYFGFYHAGTAYGNGIAEIAPFTNLNHIYGTQENLRLCRENGTLGLVDTRWQFFIEALRADWSIHWNELVEQIEDQIDWVGGFYVMDEPYWRGISPADLEFAVARIKERFPNKPVMTTFAWPVVTEHLVIPENLDWIGFDQYDDFDAIRPLLEVVKSKLAPHQRVFLVPQVFPSQSSDQEISEWFRSYASLAESDPLIIGMMAFTWHTALDVPLTFSAAQEIGTEIAGRTRRTVEVLADPANGGEVTGSGIYINGMDTVLRATPREGYRFLAWEGQGIEGSLPELHLVIDRDWSVSARFIKTWRIEATASPPKSGRVSGGSTADDGASVSLAATPNPGFFFRAWLDDQGREIGTEPEIVLTALNDSSYTAVFEPEDSDADGDGLLDLWEREHFGSLDRDGSGDSDEDGISDRAEFEHSGDPNSSDSDGDGHPDAWEHAHGYDLASKESPDPLLHLLDFAFGGSMLSVDLAGQTVVVRYRIKSDARLVSVIETSSDSIAWSEVQTEEGVTPIDTRWHAVEIPFTSDDSSPLFIRIRVAVREP